MGVGLQSPYLAAMNYFSIPGFALNLESKTSERIIFLTAAELGIKVTDMQGACRKSNFVDGRHISMYLIRLHTKMGLVEIAKIFGRDHTTVIHAIKKVFDLMPIDHDLRTTIKSIESKL